jgi:hypothetical protein
MHKPQKPLEASRKKTTQRRVMGGNIISVAKARMRIKHRTDEEAATEARKAESAKNAQKRVQTIPKLLLLSVASTIRVSMSKLSSFEIE